MVHTFIGIDPDSTSATFCLWKPADDKTVFKKFKATSKGLSECIAAIRKEPEFVLGIEGTGGYATPFEKAFAEAAITFYTIHAFQAAKEREAYLGENKSNERDALSVSHVLHSLREKNMLEKQRGHYDQHDRDIRALTRARECLVQQQTRFKIMLNQHITTTCPELAMFLNDEHPDIDGYAYRWPIVRLLANEPNISAWKSLSEDQILGLMETGKRAKTIANISNMRTILDRFPVMSPACTLVLRMFARMILDIHEKVVESEKNIAAAMKDDPFVKSLDGIKGVGTVIAATIAAEMRGRTFRNDDALASYSGLCPRKASTGTNDRELARHRYNRHLKNAFVQATMGVKGMYGEPLVRAHYKALLKSGMSKVEAVKRLARGVVRCAFHHYREAHKNTDEVIQKK